MQGDKHVRILMVNQYMINVILTVNLIILGMLYNISAVKSLNCMQKASQNTCSQLKASVYIQSNLNSSNTDGSFTMANSNSFLSTYEILPIAQEKKYLGKYSYFFMKLYVVCTH